MCDALIVEIVERPKDLVKRSPLASRVELILRKQAPREALLSERISGKQRLRQARQQRLPATISNDPYSVEHGTFPRRGPRLHAELFGQLRQVIMYPTDNDCFAVIGRIVENLLRQ